MRPRRGLGTPFGEGPSADLIGADQDRSARVEPARPPGPVVPSRPGPAAEVDAEEPAVDELQIGMTSADPTVVEQEVGIRVTADDDRGLMEDPAERGSAAPCRRPKGAGDPSPRTPPGTVPPNICCSRRDAPDRRPAPEDRPRALLDYPCSGSEKMQPRTGRRRPRPFADLSPRGPSAASLLRTRPPSGSRSPPRSGRGWPESRGRLPARPGGIRARSPSRTSRSGPRPGRGG